MQLKMLSGIDGESNLMDYSTDPMLIDPMKVYYIKEIYRSSDNLYRCDIGLGMHFIDNYHPFMFSKHKLDSIIEELGLVPDDYIRIVNDKTLNLYNSDKYDTSITWFIKKSDIVSVHLNRSRFNSADLTKELPIVIVNTKYEEIEIHPVDCMDTLKCFM